MHTESNTHLSRRKFITLVGGGTVVAATTLTGCSTAYPSAAIEAWQPVVEPIDVRRWMLAHGLLAPNPHNRQPWIADLRRNDEITLICDGDRLLPATDPFGRQITIGCGAFIELAVIAAAERGYRTKVELFPDGEPSATELPTTRAVARIMLTLDSAMPRDPLFAQIRRRHTNKTAYDNQRSVPADVWQSITSGAAERGLLNGYITDAGQMTQIRKITRESYISEMTTSHTYLESANLMRIGNGEIAKHRDGISINGNMPRLMAAIGLFNRFEVPVQGSSNYGQIMSRWTAFETGSGYFWIASRGNSRKTQIETGRAYVRAHLQATAAGVEMHPLSQALQEYSEVKPQYDSIHQLLGFDSNTVTIQMFTRVGYALAPVSHTPRRALNTFIRS